MRTLLASLVLAVNSFAAGPFIIGVRGGVPLNDIIDTVSNDGNFDSATKRYVVGPTLGVKLPIGFSVEGDALFQRLSIDFTRTDGDTRSVSASADAWTFPVMLKWTAPKSVAPFVGAGVSVRHFSDFKNVGDFLTDADYNNKVGFVAGAGIRFKAGPVYISPEIRWTRYGDSNFGDAARNFYRLKRDQAQILVGITF